MIRLILGAQTWIRRQKSLLELRFKHIYYPVERFTWFDERIRIRGLQDCHLCSPKGQQVNKGDLNLNLEIWDQPGMYVLILLALSAPVAIK